MSSSSSRSLTQGVVRTTPSFRLPRRFQAFFRQHWPMYVMLIPSAVAIILFSFYPMYGIIIAFKDYTPMRGVFNSPWAGLTHFKKFFANPNSWNIIRNTLTISLGKITLGQSAAVLFAILLSEVHSRLFKRIMQTGTTLTHFLSWIIVGSIMLQILSTSGALNKIITFLGGNPIRFLGKVSIFPWTIVISHVWKEFGWEAVIYLAALTKINPELYEAAAVDGAGRFKRIVHISLPGIKPIIIMMACLALGGVLSAGFEQILVLYNPLVYKTGDVLDTYIFRVGLVGDGKLTADYSLATAVGLLKGVIGFLLITLSYWMADKLAGYRIF